MARELLNAAPMSPEDRAALAFRLQTAETALQRAIRALDGSPEARTRYVAARAEHADAERRAQAVLSADDLVAGPKASFDRRSDLL